MWVLAILSYFGALLAFVFLTLSIGSLYRIWGCWLLASGLYYLSEWVEEQSEFAKRTLQRLIYVLPRLLISLTIDYNRNSRVTIRIRRIPILPHHIFHFFTPRVFHKLTQIPLHFAHFSFLHSIMRYPARLHAQKLTLYSPSPPRPLLLLSSFLLLPASTIARIQPLNHQALGDTNVWTGSGFLWNMCLVSSLRTVCLVISWWIGPSYNREWWTDFSWPWWW